MGSSWWPQAEGYDRRETATPKVELGTPHLSHTASGVPRLWRTWTETPEATEALTRSLRLCCSAQASMMQTQACRAISQRRGLELGMLQRKTHSTVITCPHRGTSCSHTAQRLRSHPQRATGCPRARPHPPPPATSHQRCLAPPQQHPDTVPTSPHGHPGQQGSPPPGTWGGHSGRSGCRAEGRRCCNAALRAPPSSPQTSSLKGEGRNCRGGRQRGRMCVSGSVSAFPPLSRVRCPCPHACVHIP